MNEMKLQRDHQANHKDPLPEALVNV